MFRKGFFFTLDAFVAVFIVVAGLLLLLINFTIQPYESQVVYLSEDVINFLSSSKVGPGDSNSLLLEDMRNEGNISNFDNTLLEQLSEFHFTDRNHLALELATNLTEGLLEPTHEMSIIINKSIIYNSSLQYNDTIFLVSSKRIVFGLINETHFWGPLEQVVLIDRLPKPKHRLSPFDHKSPV